MFALLVACSVPHPAFGPVQLPPPSATDWSDLGTPGPIVLQTVVSARWEVPLHGALDLDAARAVDPRITDAPLPIVLQVTTLRHPTFGVFAVDTGVDADLAAGGPGPTRGVVRGFVDGMHAEAPFSHIATGPLAAVLLTHGHLDHVLGLPDVPPGTPVILGPGELDSRSVFNGLLRGTWRSVFDGAALEALDPASAVARPPFDQAWDLTGDGALWALAAPGHTPGTLVFLARTVDGPVLLVGDVSHTRWGWDHGVPPGTYTEEPEGGRESLTRLRAFVADHPEIRVIVGHEAEGEDAVGATL